VSARLRARLEAILAAEPPRAGSLVVTLFGDVVSQHGGSVWLGGLVEVMARFGLNPGQVRTAVFRLARDGWLLAAPRGRRSYYRLTPSGQRRYARAAARIYASGHAAWDGEWTLVMPAVTDATVRDELRRRLGWLGFAVLANGVLAHPRPDQDALDELLTELGVASRVLVWRARTACDAVLPELVHGAWQLDELAARFAAFDARFRPFEGLLADGPPTGADAFVLRCLLIHEYRRILLRTVDLPPALLPPDWTGHDAMALVGALYRRVQAPAAAYARAVLSNADGPLPPPDAAFYRRFGGLERAPVDRAGDGARTRCPA